MKEKNENVKCKAKPEIHRDRATSVLVASHRPEHVNEVSRLSGRPPHAHTLTATRAGSERRQRNQSPHIAAPASHAHTPWMLRPR